VRGVVAQQGFAGRFDDSPVKACRFCCADSVVRV